MARFPIFPTRRRVEDLDVASLTHRAVTANEVTGGPYFDPSGTSVCIGVMHPGACRMRQRKIGVCGNGRIEGLLCAWPRREHQVDANTRGHCGRLR